MIEIIKLFQLGYVHIIPIQIFNLNIYFRLSGFQFSLLLRQCPSTFSHSTKVWHTTYPIRDAPLLRSAGRGAASFRKRNRAEITTLLCEQKHYPVRFSCWRKSIDYSVKIALDTSACIPASLVHQTVSPQLFRYSPSLHCLTSCVQRSSESSSS